MLTFKLSVNALRALKLYRISCLRRKKNYVTLEQNPLLWVKQQLVAVNPWDLYDQWFKTLTHISGGNLALEYLIEETAKVERAKLRAGPDGRAAAHGLPG